jgi:hypothetical protein
MPPDFGSPDATGLVSLAVGVVVTAHALWRGKDRADVMWAGFLGTFAGAGVALILYAFGLITGLY